MGDRRSRRSRVHVVDRSIDHRSRRARLHRAPGTSRSPEPAPERRGRPRAYADRPAHSRFHRPRYGADRGSTRLITAMDPGAANTLVPGAPRAATTSVSSRTFPADRTAPRAAAAWLRSLPIGLSATRLADAELCLDELVTNVVRYAWTPAADPDSHSVTVAVDRTPSELEIILQDDGRPFDPTAAVLPPIPRTLEEAIPGGRGLFLVRSIAPRLS